MSKENIRRFEELAGSVKRDGIDSLMEYIRDSDFYTAPASTRFHLSCEGGLLQHSLNVYDCLIAKKANPIWKDILEKAGDESLIIMALFHDICKTKFYVKTEKNQKTYDKGKVAAAESWQVKNDSRGDFIWETVTAYSIKDEMPLGHGEKSVMLIEKNMQLTEEELYAIRWHMGFTVDSSQYLTLGIAMEKYPIILALHEADLEASKLMEDIYGNRS